MKGCFDPISSRRFVITVGIDDSLVYYFFTNAGDPLKKDSAREYAGWVRNHNRLGYCKIITVGKSVHFQGQVKDML